MNKSWFPNRIVPITQVHKHSLHMHIISVFISILVFLLTIPTSILAVVSFIITKPYWSVACANNYCISLPLWLVINSVVSILYLLSGCNLGNKYFKSNSTHEILHDYQFSHVFLTVIIIIFKFIWNIIGAISVFGCSQICYSDDNTLSIITIITLALQWIIFAIIFTLPILKCFIHNNDYTQIV